MNLHEFVRAALRGDDLTARQSVKDAKRAGDSWGNVPAPDFQDPSELAVCAGLVELLAEREGTTPPAWTGEVGPAPEPVLLVSSAKTSPAMRRMVERGSPAPLKRRNVLATSQYLDVL